MRRRDIMSTYCTASSSERFEFLYEYFTMYAKRSLRRLPAKHRLTDICKIPAHAAQPDIYGAV